MRAGIPPRAPPRSRRVLCLLVVPGLSFGRGPAAQPVHQPGGVVLVHPRAGLLNAVFARGNGAVFQRNIYRRYSYLPQVITSAAASTTR